MSEVGVFVIGVARSGTSAVTRLVNMLGPKLPDERHLKFSRKAESDNPTGFWEVSQLSRINHRILQGFGGRSMAPPLLPAGWIDEPWVVELREEASKVFRELFDSPPWVWKHPITSMTLPFWVRTLGVRPVLVLPVRHPLETAASLRAMRGNETLTGAGALAVWERFMRSALAQSEGYPTYVAMYSDLASQPLAMAEQLATFLAENGAASDDSVKGDGIRHFVRGELRHHALDPAKTSRGDMTLSDAQSHLWALAREAAGPHQQFPPVDLGDETPWLNLVIAERLAFEVERSAVRKREKELTQELRQLTRELARARKQRAAAVQRAVRLREKLHQERRKRQLS